MPLYDYDCAACGRRIEVVHGVYSPGPTHCPNCGGGPLRKAISAPAVHFRGSGWAKRDRRATATPGSSKAVGDADHGGDEPARDKDAPARDKDAAAAKPSDSGTAGHEPSTSTTSAAGTATKTGA
jgi:putative FmdB family regulatory protein